MENKMNIWKIYKKITLINSKKYSSVYKVKEKKSGRLFAMKIINKKKYEEITNKIFNEEEINIKLNINNGINIIETQNSEDNYYIIMELCLINLKNYLKIKDKPFLTYEIKEILIQLNKYLKNIKDKQLIKLDLKSILLSIDNLDKISFKFTKSITNNNNNISTNSSVNIEKNEIDENSNIWNFGLLIYYLLFKEYPFHKGYNQELKKTNDNRLNDLLNNMLQIDKNKRISWEKYLEHQFFKPTISENFTFFCSKHSEQIDNYCVNCKINICYLCTNQHLKHKIVPFSEIGFNHTEYENFNNLLNEIEDNISKLSTLKKICQNYFRILNQ